MSKEHFVPCSYGYIVIFYLFRCSLFMSGVQPKLRIKLKSYDLTVLEASVAKIVGLLVKSSAAFKGPIPLPKKRKMYTVIKAHFVYKDTRDQYERITYTRLIDVVETGPKTIEFLQNLSVPVGVAVEVKMF